MKSKQLSTPDLEDLRRQFPAWRKTRKHRDRTPEQLWSSAADLARVLSVTCKACPFGERAKPQNRAILRKRGGGVSRTPGAIRQSGRDHFRQAFC
jgi:hypothetical protein